MIHAYEQRDAFGRPLQKHKTPEQVVLGRMSDAFRVLRKIPGTIGPRAFGGNWPSIVQESQPVKTEAIAMMRDFVREVAEDEFADARGVNEIMKYLDENDANARRFQREDAAPDKYDISRMDEALRWPAQFLIDYPKAADAINLWAMGVGFGANIEAILKARANRAGQIASVLTREANKRRNMLRKEIAAGASSWARKRAETGISDELRERIIHNATIKLERELKSKGLAQAIILIEPSSVFHDKVISRTRLDHHRYVAATIIAKALRGKI